MQIPGTWTAYIPPIAMNVLLACTSILAAIMLAQLMFVWIETPFMALGKHVSQRLTGLGYSASPSFKGRGGVNETHFREKGKVEAKQESISRRLARTVQLISLAGDA